MATAESEELRALAQRVADALPPEAIEVVLTGSVSRGVADEVSDIELLVVTEDPLLLEDAFELARVAGLEERENWGDPSTPTRRVSGYFDGQPVETIWWSRELAEELFDRRLGRGARQRCCPADERPALAMAGAAVRLSRSRSRQSGSSRPRSAGAATRPPPC